MENTKILFIGVGSAGRKVAKRMKGICPDSECLSFGCFEYDKEYDNEHTVPHYNLVRLNGLDSISCGTNSSGMKKLAEYAEDKIKAIIQYHLNNSNDGVDNTD